MPSLAWGHFYTVSVEFPHPNNIDHFTYTTETEKPNDWVYLYDSMPKTEKNC